MTAGLRILVDVLAPPSLGRGFRWLFAGVTAMNLGDGVLIAAGPLLIASLTRDPFFVALAWFFEFLPALVFGVIAGVVADRVDRLRLSVAMNLVRLVVLAGLAATAISGRTTIGIVFAALLLLGSAETFADIGSSNLLPRLVNRSGLGLANARIQGSTLLTNQLIGPPVGAFLFALGVALPFVADAVLLGFGVVLLSRVRGSLATVVAARRAAELAAPAAAAARSVVGRVPALRVVRDDLVEGLRWLAGHPPMRTLALTIFAFNVTFGAAWSVMVLYATDHLGMDTVGFGLLTTAAAIGGLIGTTAYGSLERRFGLANLMRIGLLIETGTHLTLALTRSPAVALAVMVVFGVHEFVWGTTSTTVRQRAVPDAVLGRVSGIYRVGINAGIVIGTPIGGLLAGAFGLTAPFWFGFIGSAILVAVMWRELGHIAHSEAPTEA